MIKAYRKNNKEIILKILWLQLLLIFFFLLNGFLVTLFTPDKELLKYFGLLPLAIGLFIYLIETGTWKNYFSLKKCKRMKDALLLSSPLLLVLFIVFVGNKGIHTAAMADFFLMFLMQIFVVAFIEEVIFRGFILKLLLPKSMKKAVLISSLLFAMTHSLQLLGGQSLEATFMQMVYAFVVGMALSLLVIHQQSLIIAVAFHGFNNFLQIMGKTEGPSFLNYIVICILITYVIFLWKRATAFPLRKHIYDQ